MKRLLTSRERLIGAPVGARELPRTLMISAFNSAADSRGIMGLAGGLDNRWSRNAGREESPDTSSAQAEKGNAPGNARGRFGCAVYPDCALHSRHGQCHRDYTACEASR